VTARSNSRIYGFPERPILLGGAGVGCGSNGIKMVQARLASASSTGNEHPPPPAQLRRVTSGGLPGNEHVRHRLIPV
jgi:hypothetical protein